MGIYIFGVLLIFVIAVVVWFRMFKSCCASKGSDNVVNVPELPDYKTVYQTPESTLAKRKEAILDLFETEQVTMVSNDHTSMGNPSEIKQFTSMEKLTTS